jgi:seryl-tRNA synthetase
VAEQSSLHAYLNWTKQRIDEMDATVASLEAKGSQLKAESKVKADQLIADLKTRRDEFQATITAQLAAAEAKVQANKAQLEAQWPGFEAQVKAYFQTVGNQVEQQQAAFRDIAGAQIRAWQKAADESQDSTMRVGAAKRYDLDAALKHMKAGAAEAEARFQKLKQAGGESWTALGGALADSRTAFDRATQQAWDALRRALPPAA